MQKVDISAQLGLNNYERSARNSEKRACLGDLLALRPVFIPIVDGAISVHCAKSDATPNAMADFVLEQEPQGTMLVGLANFRRLVTSEGVSVVGLLTDTGLILPEVVPTDFTALAVRITDRGAQDLIGVSDVVGEVAFPGADPFGTGSYARVCLDAVSKRMRET